MKENKPNIIIATLFIWITNLLVSGLIVKLLWNYLAPTLFNNNVINYAQSICLYILVRTLVESNQKIHK
jgi:hypothetical protein